MSQIHTAVFNTLGAVDQWMKTISSNITGSTIHGYKGTDVHFGEVLNVQMRSSARATDGYGSVNAVQRADSGARITSTSTDFTQGSVTQTSQPTDLALSGDGFFVLSRVPVPRSMDDLVFTRNGSFHFDFLQGPVAGTGTYRLVNGDGMFVMGWNSPVDGTNREFGTAPEENNGTDLNAFNTSVFNGAGNPGLTLNLQNIQLDAVRNPSAASNNVSFNKYGQLFVDGGQPRDLANNFANMHVALAKFANPQGLDRSGGGADFTYDPVAGQVFSGTAAGGPNKVVGSNNVITPSALENANTSINTVMPELTLAQKSFSATSKIISVGNTMIDDVTGLIR